MSAARVSAVRATKARETADFDVERSERSISWPTGTITEQRPGILAAIEHRLSNARVEAANTTIRLIARRAFGFHSAEALIALAKLTLSGLCPPLPGRAT